MNYDFPLIQHINDVLPAIKDSPEFIVAQKDGYQVINYVVATSDTFPDVKVAGGSAEMRKERSLHNRLRRECRGLIFDMDGKLVNRRYHKFFNVNERDETLAHRLLWDRPHVILEKLDGSMVSPCPVRNHVRWMTKMGVTDTSMEAEAFVAKNPHYALFARNYLIAGFTPIFEWCSKKNRIVLDYAEDRLVLTGLRDIVRGTYMLHDALEAIGERYGIEVVKAYDYKSEGLLELVRQQEDTEGVVVRFDDGHMVKIKSDWYVRIHKVKSLLENEREVVALVLRNELDDLFPVLPPEDVKKVQDYAYDLKLCVEDLANDISKEIAYCKDEYKTKKDFALRPSGAADYTPLIRSMIFRHFEAPPEAFVVYQELVDTILKHTQTNTAFRKVKEEFLKEISYE